MLPAAARAPWKITSTSSFELDATLERRGKKELLEVSRKAATMARVSYVRQKEPLGLGHAVLCAKDLVGDEPFAVVLPDDVIDAPRPCIAQMIDVFNERGGSVLATMTIEGAAIIGRYILTPRVFALLEQTRPGAGGEIQLTDGILVLLKEERVFGYTFEGKRFDAGDKFGMLRATVEFALKRPDLAGKFREYLKGLSV